MFLGKEDEDDPRSSLSRSPVRHQHPRNHVADQRGAKTGPPQRDGKLLGHLGENLEEDPKNQIRIKKRSTFPRSHQKRSNENSQPVLPHSSVFLFLVKFWD